VFTSGLEQDDITTQLEKLNIRTERFYPTNISDITSIIKELGDILHEETKADSLYNYFNDKFNEFKDRIELMDYKPNVYVEIYGDPIMTASNDAYLGELLAYSGGNNVFPVLPRDYCRISPEEVVKANPDIIIITYPGVSVDDICNRKGWNNISAVKNKKIYTVYDINPDLILRAGLRNVEGVERLQELLEIK
jgi:iron complex transport system substrate-binding protein